MTALEFNTSVINLHEFITRFAFKFTKDDELAKDLAQETVLKALKNRDKFKSNTNLKGWMKVILKNTFINGYRKKSNQLISYNSEDYKVQNGTPDNYKPDDILNLDHIHSLIAELDNDLSSPFLMHVEGFKYHEIAEELNLPLGTVKSRIHQTRQILTKQLKHER